MPTGMTKNIAIFPVELETSWDEDTLIQQNSTFIPTASAMDLNCNGTLAVKDNCAFTQSHSGFPFMLPGTKSSGDAVYAVDATHPRYNEAISGRHIELPSENMKADTSVIAGLQVDMWRVLCELANFDYDSTSKEFRNQNLSWYFAPGTDCIDQSKMPAFLKTGGYVQKKSFAYSRYDYNADATEQDKKVRMSRCAALIGTVLSLSSFAQVCNDVSLYKNGEAGKMETTNMTFPEAPEWSANWGEMNPGEREALTPPYIRI